MDRIISVSTAAFDGYDLSVAIDEISRLGASHVELAFIQGYMDSFDEDYFSEIKMLKRFKGFCLIRAYILKTLASKYPQIPISLEIPLRITQDRDASPRRAASPLPLDEIRNVLKGSLHYVKGIIENRVGTNCDA